LIGHFGFDNLKISEFENEADSEEYLLIAKTISICTYLTTYYQRKSNGQYNRPPLTPPKGGGCHRTGYSIRLCGWSPFPSRGRGGDGVIMIW
jgi:hypothetical protein